MKQLYSYLQSLSVFAAFILSSLSAFAQPGNTCSQAISVPVNINTCTVTTVSNVGLSASGISPTNCPGYNGGDLWLAVVMPPSGQLTFRAQLNLTTPTFSMDINMAVYSGVCGSLVQIGCDTDSGPGFYPELAFSGTPGVTHYIQLWDIGNNQADNIDVCAIGAPTCISPTATTTRLCGAANQYSVNVNITNLGSAPSLNILNNAGAPAINNVTSTGIYNVGPFSLGQTVTITIQNPNDASCNVLRVLSDVGLGCNRIVTCGNLLNQTYCYANSDNSVFLYSSSNNSPITLTFASGLIQNGSDIITIRNGTTGTSPILFQGSNAGNLAGLTRTASSGSIFMRVTSNIAGSCSDNSLGLGGGWNWNISCVGNTQCQDASLVLSQTSLAQSLVSSNVADFSYSGNLQCAGPGVNADPFFRFVAVGSVTYFSAQGSGDFNAAIEVFNSCGGSQLACSNTAGAGAQETFWIDNLIPGAEYVYRVHHAGANPPSQTSFVTGVYHIPQVRLRTDFCGATGLTANSIIRSTSANPATNLQNYIFEFTEIQPPFTVYEVVSPNGINPQFRMFWFTNFEYGRTYSVRTKVVMYAGPNMGNYGPACNITFAPEPVSGLQAIFNGGNFQLCNTIKATPVNATINYRWLFDSGTEIFEFNSNSSSYFCNLENVQGLTYGTTYAVQVFVTGGGTESGVSTPGTISLLPTTPTTSLNPAFIACGSSVTLTAWTQAFKVCGATSYDFRMTNLTTPGTPIEVARPNRIIAFNTVAGLVAGNTYNVAARATAGGATAPYGAECAISFVAPAPGIAPEVENLETTQVLTEGPNTTIYPNPNAGENLQVLISNLDAQQQQIQIEIYDLTGKLVSQENFGSSNTSFRASMPVRGQLAQGVYIVNTRIDGIVLSTEKLFVK